MKIPSPEELDKRLPILKEIDRQLEADQGAAFRYHLGASAIGDDANCDRKLWYSFRWFTNKQHKGRMLRLFQRGHNEEPVLLDHIQKTGAIIHQVNKATGRQFGFKKFGGHYAGECDGVLQKVFGFDPDDAFLFECKTAKTSDFKAMLKSQSVQKSKPQHYVQCQVYMAELKLKAALYFMVCKENDDIYCELIPFDAATASRAEDKAYSIITTLNAPDRITNDSSFFKCKFCDHSDICHHGKEPERNCRTCIFSSPDLEFGGWECEKGYMLATQFDIKAMQEHGHADPYQLPCEALGKRHEYEALV